MIEVLNGSSHAVATAGIDRALVDCDIDTVLKIVRVTLSTKYVEFVMLRVGAASHTVFVSVVDMMEERFGHVPQDVWLNYLWQGVLLNRERDNENHLIALGYHSRISHLHKSDIVLLLIQLGKYG